MRAPPAAAAGLLLLTGALGSSDFPPPPSGVCWVKHAKKTVPCATEQPESCIFDATYGCKHGGWGNTQCEWSTLAAAEDGCGRWSECMSFTLQTAPDGDGGYYARDSADLQNPQSYAPDEAVWVKSTNCGPTPPPTPAPPTPPPTPQPPTPRPPPFTPAPGPPVPGQHRPWDGTCFACARFPEMANFTGRDLDWDAKGAASPIKHQDDKACYNCDIYAAVEDVESAWWMAGHDLTPLSVRQVTDCAPHPSPSAQWPYRIGNCKGGPRYHYYEWMVNVSQAGGGLVSEETYPWTAGSRSPTPDDPVPCITKKTKPVVATVTDWIRIAVKGDPDAESKLLDAVTKVGPISVGMSSKHLHNYCPRVETSNPDSHCDEVTVPSGIDNPGQPESSTGSSHCSVGDDHGLLLVGYGYDEATKLDYWKLRNEWGDTWGEKGYYRLARGGNGAGKDIGAGHCGVAWYAYHAIVTPKDRFHCHTTSHTCHAAFSGHSTLAKCEAACGKP